MPGTITEYLKCARLAQYEDALRTLGVTTPSELQDLNEADFLGVGMKKVEIKRLMRIVDQTV
jgi:hypothetical protein